jgi:hypothetical protein
MTRTATGLSRNHSSAGSEYAESSVVDGVSGETMGARNVLLLPSDRGVDRHVHQVDALRHQLTSHALRETGFRMTGHGERIGRAACWPTRNALKAAFINVARTMPASTWATACRFARITARSSR